MSVSKFGLILVGMGLIGAVLSGCATAPADQSQLRSIQSVYVAPIPEPQIGTMSMGGGFALPGRSLSDVLTDAGVHLALDTRNAVIDALKSDDYGIAPSADSADAVVQVKISAAQYFAQPPIAGGGCTPFALFDVVMKSRTGKTLLDRTYRLQSGGGVGITGHVLLPSDPKYDVSDCNQISTNPEIPVGAFRSALALLKSAVAADMKKAS